MLLRCGKKENWTGASGHLNRSSSLGCEASLKPGALSLALLGCQERSWGSESKEGKGLCPPPNCKSSLGETLLQKSSSPPHSPLQNRGGLTPSTSNQHPKDGARS